MVAFFPKNLSASVNYKRGNNDTKKNNSRTWCALIVVQLLALTQSNTIDSKASAELAVPTVKSYTTTAPNSNGTMTIHTTNSIQGTPSAFSNKKSLL